MAQLTEKIRSKPNLLEALKYVIKLFGKQDLAFEVSDLNKILKQSNWNFSEQTISQYILDLKKQGFITVDSSFRRGLQNIKKYKCSESVKESSV